MTAQRHLLVGCSFTDPLWQKDIPWSVEYAKIYPSYIVAKAGIGIKGISTEALYYLKTLPDVSKVIMVLPTMWRMDIEMYQENYLCNSMVHLLEVNPEYQIRQPAVRKWITSGGLHYSKETEQAKIFDLLYKHQGFLVLAKEHLRALQNLIIYCKINNISYYVTTIQDPLDQLIGLDYIQKEIYELLSDVEYQTWFKFDNKFIDRFLGHSNHPTTNEHVTICKHIVNKTQF